MIRWHSIAGVFGEKYSNDGFLSINWQRLHPIGPLNAYHSLWEFTGLDLSGYRDEAALKNNKRIFDPLKLCYWLCGGNPRSLNMLLTNQYSIGAVIKSTQSALEEQNALQEISKALYLAQDTEIRKKFEKMDETKAQDLWRDVSPFNLKSVELGSLKPIQLRTAAKELHEDGILHIENDQCLFHIL